MRTAKRQPRETMLPYPFLVAWEPEAHRLAQELGPRPVDGWGIERAEFHASRTIRRGGRTWRVAQVLEASDGELTSRLGVMPQRELDAVAERRLRSGGTFTDLAWDIVKSGYSGGWELDAGGITGSWRANPPFDRLDDATAVLTSLAAPRRQIPQVHYPWIRELARVTAHAHSSLTWAFVRAMAKRGGGDFRFVRFDYLRRPSAGAAPAGWWVDRQVGIASGFVRENWHVQVQKRPVSRATRQRLVAGLAAVGLELRWSRPPWGGWMADADVTHPLGAAEVTMAMKRLDRLGVNAILR